MALIDRDTLIAKIRDEGILGNGYSDSEREDDVIDMIESCQTVDAKPVVHGGWILKHIGAGHYWECSACHKNPCIYVTEDTNFCPNCGADMMEEANET